ncbi:MAG: lipopolysaccharide kinase InaA family protein [Candidatus Brocadiia bacterium]
MNTQSKSRTVLVRAHGLRWRCVEDFAQTLPKVDVLRLRRPEDFAAGEVVKDNKVRTVAWFANPDSDKDRGLYVKRFKFPDFLRKAKCLIRPTQAAREWKMGRLLIKKGIPTCRVLAVAERRRKLFHREALLISEEIPGVKPLSEWLEENDWLEVPRKVREGLLEELAGVVARLARVGACHKDFHVGNIMIDPDASRGERIWVLDLHSVSLWWTTRSRIIRMLVYLMDSTCEAGIRDADRVEFLRYFFEEWRGESPGENTFRAWTRRIQRAWKRRRRRHMKSRTKRCLVESSEFTRDRRDGFRIFHRREFQVPAALEVVRKHQKAIAGAENGCELYKVGSRTEISECTTPSGRKVFVKAFLRRSIKERVKSFFRLSPRARAAWRRHRGFRVRRLPAPQGLALLETTNKLSGRPDYLVTEDVGCIKNLQELGLALTPRWEKVSGPELSFEERRQLGRAVGELFDRLAEREVRHYDMKPSNILVSREDGQFRLHLVDLDHAQFRVHWKEKHWIQHLAQCNAGLAEGVSVLERMRVLRQIGRGRWSASQRLRIARAVLELSLTRRPVWLRDPT